MPDAYVGQLQAFAFDAEPQGWIRCDGRLLQIPEHEFLFSMLGLEYGGDGAKTFAVPDLRGRTVVNAPDLEGNVGHGSVGRRRGTEAKTIERRSLPPHEHKVTLMASQLPATERNPVGQLPAIAEALFYKVPPTVEMERNFPEPALVLSAGGEGQAVENMQPYLPLSWCICVEGLWASRPGESMFAPPQLIGEIRFFGFNFAPGGWTLCDGALLRVTDGYNSTLKQLLGTHFGGDGKTTIRVPNLVGRIAVHKGQGPGLSAYTLEEQGGQNRVLLKANELPAHTHKAVLHCSSEPARRSSPVGALPARTDTKSYGLGGESPRHPDAVQVPAEGGAASYPIENRLPTLSVTACLANAGMYPEPNERATLGSVLGQVSAFALDFTPGGWLACDGQLLNISEYRELFEVIGTKFGGDGQATFAVPDLRGRVVLGARQVAGQPARSFGQAGSAETIELTPEQLPAHQHWGRLLAAAGQADSNSPTNTTWCDAQVPVYGDFEREAMADSAVVVEPSGGQGKPVPNVQEYQVVNWCIAAKV